MLEDPVAESLVLGFIGVGVMGEPMCRHLTKKSGRKVLVSDNHTAPLARLENEGAFRASSQQIAQEASIIFLSLPSGDVVREVLTSEQGILPLLSPGQIIVDLSTSSVESTRKIAGQLKDKGIKFADAPVMRTRAAAESGTLAIPVGASDDVYAHISRYLGCFASDIKHAGNIGAGQIVKILNNMVLYETVLALSEAHAIGKRAGVDPQVLFEAFADGSADSFALRNHGMGAILPQHFPEAAFPVYYARKDVGYAMDLATQMGIDATGARNLVSTFDRAIEAGHGDRYAPAISLIFEEK
ncbi:NAD(P)-dependent oxidoreductase [Salinicola sp. MIT1003]|uniref:NAD(P)-dependent oxidoreductase n=1 Tax=Salinicola sp. MIT1003 TaxID=1882734 RepID=UPI0008DE3C73|nr:NAD(P)-dependent oxidoreductase [Salinicola sp. MIT1003]OHZ01933.1 2-hydroxy-3-oxopropionate reductase [Salinicola sp. MIT1003]